MKMIELGWVAGILDGEGSIVLDPQSKGWRRPALSITSTDLEILQGVQELIGGSIIPIKKYKNRMKPAWIWRLQGPTKVIDALSELEPILRCPKKKRRARYLIENYAKFSKRNGDYSPEEVETKKSFEDGFFLL